MVITKHDEILKSEGGAKTSFQFVKRLELYKTEFLIS